MSTKRRLVPRLDDLETRNLLSSIHRVDVGMVEVFAKRTPVPKPPPVSGSINGSFGPGSNGGVALQGGGSVSPTVGTVKVGGTTNLAISTTPGSPVAGGLVLVVPATGSAQSGQLILDLSGRVPRRVTTTIPVKVKVDPASTGIPSAFLGESGTGTIHVTSISPDGTGTFTFQFALKPHRR